MAASTSDLLSAGFEFFAPPRIAFGWGRGARSVRSHARSAAGELSSWLARARSRPAERSTKLSPR